MTLVLKDCILLDFEPLKLTPINKGSQPDFGRCTSFPKSSFRNHRAKAFQRHHASLGLYLLGSWMFFPC